MVVVKRCYIGINLSMVSSKMITVMAYSTKDVELTHADNELTPLIDVENVDVIGTASVLKIEGSTPILGSRRLPSNKTSMLLTRTLGH